MVKVLIADDQVLIRAGIAAILRAAPGYEVVGEACDGNEAGTMAELTEPDVVLMDIRMPEMDGIAATRRILSSGRERPPRILILTTFDLDEYVYKALRAGASGFVLKDTPPERLLAALKAVADGDTLFSPTVTRRLVQAYCAAEGLVSGDVLPGAAQLPHSAPGHNVQNIQNGRAGSNSNTRTGPGSPAALTGPAGQTAPTSPTSPTSPNGPTGQNNGGWPSIPAARSAAGDGREAAARAALAALTARETDVLRLVAAGLSNGEIAERLVVSEGTVKTHLNRSMAKLNLSSRAQVVVLAYESGLVVPGRPQPSAPAPARVTAGPRRNA